MCDKRLVLSEIGQIIETIDVVLRRTKDIQILNDFLLSESGMILLDSVCMKLIAIGESVKKLDRLTNKDLPFRGLERSYGDARHHCSSLFRDRCGNCFSNDT